MVIYVDVRVIQSLWPVVMVTKDFRFPLFRKEFQFYLATHNACASNPCVHGVCIEGLTSFICDCFDGWTGRTCHGNDGFVCRWKSRMCVFSLEKIGSSCTNNHCGNGKCFPINDPSLLYVCLCLNGQLAASCNSHEIRLTTGCMLIAASSSSLEICDPLKPQSCMNGGQCLPTMDGYQCLCTSGFTGRFCQMSRWFWMEMVLNRYLYLETNACNPNPCE